MAGAFQDGYVAMWSGGKDSALALRRAQAAGLEVRGLLSMFDSASRRIRFHATRQPLIEAQAAALDLPLRAMHSTWPSFDRRLRAELAWVRRAGCRGVVFGDIHLADVRAWYQERVEAAGLEHVEPLWGEAPAALLDEFVGAEGRAVVTCVELSRLGEEWLGRVVDRSFSAEIGDAGVDPCGENGEFHTFAFAGPPFPHRVGWRLGRRRDQQGFAQVDLEVNPEGVAPVASRQRPPGRAPRDRRGPPGER